MYLNKVTLIGNLTRDPELKSLPNGSKVANFSLATNRTWKDSNGAKQESVEFHNIVSFGKQAEIIGQYCKKGKQLLVDGRLQTRSWEDKETNEKKYKTEIILESFQFGNNKNDSDIDQSNQDDAENEVEEPKEQSIDPETGIDTSEIPFN